mgnify:CR=1 FL=1
MSHLSLSLFVYNNLSYEGEVQLSRVTVLDPVRATRTHLPPYGCRFGGLHHSIKGQENSRDNIGRNS